MSIESVMPSNHLILCRPFLRLPSIFPSKGSFQISQLLASGGQSIGVSASTSVLPMNTQDWCHLGWTGCITLQSKGLSRIFSNTTVQKRQFFCAQYSCLENPMNGMKKKKQDRRSEFTFRIKPQAQRAQTNLVHPRTQRPHRDWDRTSLSVSCGGTGQQWTATGAGALGAADLGMAGCSRLA